MATIPVAIPALRSMIISRLQRIGYSAVDAAIIGDALMHAELRGNNQGLIKLISGALIPSSSGDIVTVHQTPVSARLNGNHRSGMVVVSSAVDIAINKARACGVSIVGCYNYASATGALGHWASKIAKENLIGVVMSQCNEMVAPHGSYEPVFGTNPIAIGIPTSPRPQVLDMATSASAWFGLVTAMHEGESIAEDIAYDSNGHPTTDPAQALRGALRVFDRSFKGSHLALMVELLAGAWTGAAMSDKEASKNWGSLVIAIDPNIIAPLDEFQTRAAVMCDRVKNAKRLPGEEGKEIYLPGERGDRLAEERLKSGVIEISRVIYSKMEEFE